MGIKEEEGQVTGVGLDSGWVKNKIVEDKVCDLRGCRVFHKETEKSARIDFIMICVTIFWKYITLSEFCKNN